MAHAPILAWELEPEMRKLSLFGGLAILAIASSLVGCDPNKENATPANNGQPNPAPAPVVAAGAPSYKLITNGISPFWDSMAKGIDAASKELGVNGGWQAPNPADHNAQVKVFKDVVASKVDGIGVSAIEASALAATIDEATAAGIPVICFDSDSPTSKRLCYLGTNNFEAGRIAGENAAKLFPNGGKLVAFVGNMGAQNARDRYNGFKEALKAHPNITFLQEPFEDNKDKGRARKNVEDAITRYSAQGLTGLVGLYSYNGPAIVGAVQAANIRSKMKVICFDGEPETLKNLAAGLVDVTVVQKPYEFGHIGIKLLDLIHKDKAHNIDNALQALKPDLDKLNMKLDAKQRIIDTGVDVITPANAQEFLKQLKEKGLEST